MHSPNNFEPPIYLVPRNLENHNFQYTSQKNSKYIKDRHKIIRLAESTKKSPEVNIQLESFVKKSTRDICCNTTEEIYDPAAKMLVITIKWLHGISSFAQIKNSEQISLLHCNWRELFILTASQHSFHFDEGKI